MSIFNRKKVEKESNVASTPENAKPKVEFSVAKFYYMLWYIFSMTFHICYVTYIIITIAQENFLSTVIKYLLYGYAAALILIVLISLGNKSKLKARLTNYKSALNFLKYLIQMISFVLSLVTAISSFFTTGKFDSIAMSSAITSLLLTAIMAFFEFLKVMIRKNIPIVKQNFLRMKEHGDVEDIKGQTPQTDDTANNLTASDDLLEAETAKDSNQSDNFLIDISQNETESSPQNSLNAVPKKSLFNKFFKKNKVNTNEIQTLEQTDNQDKINADIMSQNESELTLPTTSLEPELSKNEKFDKNAGVIISYDDEDEEDEDYDDYYESLDPAISKAKKQSNKFSRIIKKYLRNK